MRARSKRWILEVGYSDCACGSQIAVAVNAKSKERMCFKHTTPTGEVCPEWTWQEGVERTRRICEAAGIPF